MDWASLGSGGWSGGRGGRNTLGAGSDCRLLTRDTLLFMTALVFIKGTGRATFSDALRA